jgi:hypothetical protein
MPPTKNPPEFKPRKCKYCKLTFVPMVGAKNNRRNAELQRFCCDKHRRDYHRHGGLNWPKLEEKIQKLVAKLVKQELEKTAAEFRTEMRNAIAMQIPGDSRPRYFGDQVEPRQ